MKPAPSAARTSELVPLVYDELRQLAAATLARERPGHTLQATALVHELYLRLAGQRKSRWDSRAQFFAAASAMIRRILVNHERDRRSARRGGRARRVVLEDRQLTDPADPLDLLVLEELLQRLTALSERQGRIVELRFYGGLSVDEVAEVLDVSPRTVASEWAVARAWLRAALQRGEGA